MRPYFYIKYLQRSDLQRSDLQALRADLQLSYIRSA
jgi:hypothetical protein